MTGAVWATVAASSLIFFAFAWWFFAVGHRFRARLSDVNIPLARVVGMRLRRSPVEAVIRATVRANKGGFPIDSDQVEAHHMAGGDIDAVVDAVVSRRVGWDRACALDLGKGGKLTRVLDAASKDRRIILERYADELLAIGDPEETSIRQKCRETVGELERTAAEIAKFTDDVCELLGREGGPGGREAVRVVRANIMQDVGA